MAQEIPNSLNIFEQIDKLREEQIVMKQTANSLIFIQKDKLNRDMEILREDTKILGEDMEILRKEQIVMKRIAMEEMVILKKEEYSHCVDCIFEATVVQTGQCPMCYNTKQLIAAPICKHNYCRECILKWLIVNNKCPNCRVGLCQHVI